MSQTVIILILFLVISIWILSLFIIKKRYRGERVAVQGPILLLKTARGISLIERISRNRFWNYYSTVCVFIGYILMIFSIGIIIWQVYIISTTPTFSKPSPLYAIGLPGINPIIPITYGIVGIIIAIIVHEGAHGLIVAKNKLRIVSMGLAFLVIPIGAFVEPDEKEIEKTDKNKRIRIYSSGPSTNIIVGIVFAMIFISCADCITPKHNGPLVIAEYIDSPFRTGDIITTINNVSVEHPEEISNLRIEPGRDTKISVLRGESILSLEYKYGLYVTSTLKNSPAEYTGIRVGDIIHSIDGTIVYDHKIFREIMDNRSAGETITIIIISNSSLKRYNVTLVDKYEYYYKNYNIRYEEYRGKGLLGVSTALYGIGMVGASELLDIIKNYSLTINSFVKFISLPFLGLEPLPQDLKSAYNVPFNGWWEILHYSYWIAWLNLLVGLTNLLPAIPLDGGYIFRDSLLKFFEKKKNGERIVNILTLALSIAVLILILWMFIYPRI